MITIKKVIIELIFRTLFSANFQQWFLSHQFDNQIALLLAIIS